MIKKYLVFFFVLTLYVQQNAGSEITSEERLFDLQGQVARGIANLVEDAERRTSEANGLVKLYTDQVNNLGNDRYNDAYAVINDIKVSTDLDLNTRVTSAGGDLGKLLACTKQYEKELEEFWVSTVQSVTSCVTDKIEKAFTIIKNIVNAAFAIANVAMNIQDKIDTSCPVARTATTDDRIFQAGCALVIIAQASIEIINYGLVIAYSIVEAIALISSISTLQIELPICLATKAVLAGLSFVPVIVPIVECTLS